MTQGPGPTREARLQRARAWLRYATRDMRTAQALAREAPGRFAPYQAAFWAQQSAEKALKGALAYAGVDFGDTHRLTALAALLPPDWTATRALPAADLTQLSRYAVETRYPDLGEPEPTAADARRAVSQAVAVQQALRRDLEAHGFPFPQRSPHQAPPQEQQGRASDSDHGVGRDDDDWHDR